MKEKAIFCLILSFVMFILFYFVFKLFFKSWAVLRNKSHISATCCDYDNLGIIFRIYIIQFFFSLMGVLLIILGMVNLILYAIHIFKEILNLDFNQRNIIIISLLSVSLVLFLSLTKWIIKGFFKIFNINFLEYESLSYNYNTINKVILKILVLLFNITLIILIHIFLLGIILL